MLSQVPLRMWIVKKGYSWSWWRLVQNTSLVMISLMSFWCQIWSATHHRAQAQPERNCSNKNTRPQSSTRLNRLIASKNPFSPPDQIQDSWIGSNHRIVSQRCHDANSKGLSTAKRHEGWGKQLLHCDDVRGTAAFCLAGNMDRHLRIAVIEHSS